MRKRILTTVTASLLKNPRGLRDEFFLGVGGSGRSPLESDDPAHAGSGVGVGLYRSGVRKIEGTKS